MGNSRISKHRPSDLGPRPKNIDARATSELRLLQAISRTETKLQAMHDSLDMQDMHEIGQLAKGVAADAADIATHAATRYTLANVQDGTYADPKGGKDDLNRIELERRLRTEEAVPECGGCENEFGYASGEDGDLCPHFSPSNNDRRCGGFVMDNQ
jgi:hypothetical protein